MSRNRIEPGRFHVALHVGRCEIVEQRLRFLRMLRAEAGEAAMARIKAGEPFATVAREVSEDANRERGGQIRIAGRLRHGGG